MLPQHANARRRTTADVKYAAGRVFSGRLTGEEICLHDIRDEGEVARLPAVAEDHRRGAAQGGGNEQRHDGSVMRVEILTRSENVEVAQHDRLEPMRAPERLAVRLARQFGRGVGGK